MPPIRSAHQITGDRMPIETTSFRSLPACIIDPRDSPLVSLDVEAKTRLHPTNELAVTHRGDTDRRQAQSLCLRESLSPLDQTSPDVVFRDDGSSKHSRNNRDISRIVKGNFPMDVIFPEMTSSGMETSLQKRLRIRMDMLGLNAYQTAKRAGLGDSFVRDILRGRTRSPNATNLSKLAVALETTTDWFYGEGDDDRPLNRIQSVGGLDVVGKIQAGNWVDRSIVDDTGEREIIPVARDPRFPHAKQYALSVTGDSMDLEFPEGTYVTCVDYFDSGLTLRDGLIVHVERHNGALVEMTLKAVETVDGVQMLVPRSSNPRHKPIKPDGDEGTEILVKGVVTGSYRRTVL